MKKDTIISEALRPITESLNADTAKHFAELRMSDGVQQRVNELATKCNEGELSDEERDQYESLVSVGNILAVLKAKAKKIVAGQS